MINNNIINEDLRKLSIDELITKYDKEEDLYVITSILVQERNYDYLCNMVLKLPKLEKYDNIKSVIIRDNIDLFPPYLVFLIIESVSNDEKKVNLLEKYSKKLQHMEVEGIIITLKDDNLKKKLFRDYIKYFNAEDFSDYVRSIKDADSRTSEFLLFKDKFLDYRLDWIISSYSSEEKKLELLNNISNEENKKQL